MLQSPSNETRKSEAPRPASIDWRTRGEGMVQHGPITGCALLADTHWRMDLNPAHRLPLRMACSYVIQYYEATPHASVCHL